MNNKEDKQTRGFSWFCLHTSPFTICVTIASPLSPPPWHWHCSPVKSTICLIVWKGPVVRTLACCQVSMQIYEINKLLYIFIHVMSNMEEKRHVSMANFSPFKSFKKDNGCFPVQTGKPFLGHPVCSTNIPGMEQHQQQG